MGEKKNQTPQTENWNKKRLEIDSMEMGKSVK